MDGGGRAFVVGVARVGSDAQGGGVDGAGRDGASREEAAHMLVGGAAVEGHGG